MTSAEPDFYLSYLPQSWLIIRDDWLIDHLDVSPWASSLSSLTRWLIPEYIYCKAVSWWFGEDVSTEQLLIKITVVLCFYTGIHGQDLILQRLGAGIEDNGQFAYPAGYKSLILYIHEILHPVLQRFLAKILNLLWHYLQPPCFLFFWYLCIVWDQVKYSFHHILGFFTPLIIEQSLCHDELWRTD